MSDLLADPSGEDLERKRARDSHDGEVPAGLRSYGQHTYIDFDPAIGVTTTSDPTGW